MWPFNKNHVPTKNDEIRYSAIKRVRRLKTKNNKRYDNKHFDDFAKLFRRYLRKKYNLRESLIHEELSDKIKSKRLGKTTKVKIIYLSAAINSIEYGSKDSNKKTLKELLDKFNNLIKTSA
jgi:hypothetical protein